MKKSLAEFGLLVLVALGMRVAGAWALGGAAAAVAGLALLGYSSRRSVTTVPV